MRVRIPVYLAQYVLEDKSGREHLFPERRLIRPSPEAEVIAIIEAPAGTRIRARRGRRGSDRLIIPRGDTLWDRLFHRRNVSAKHVISLAREGSYGLSLVVENPQREKSSADSAE